MNQKKAQPSLKMNFILNTLLQIMKLIAPMLTIPYVSRVLGANQIGVYSYAYSINYCFVMLAGLGTATYGIIETAKVRDNKEQLSKVFWEIELITLCTSVVCICIWAMVSFICKEYTEIMLVMTLYLLAVIFDISWFYLGIEMVKYTVIINSFFKILGVILTFILVKDHNALTIYTIILSGSTLAGNIGMWFFLPKYIEKAGISVYDMMRHIKGTVIYFIPTIASSVYMVADKTLIGAITHDNAEIGYYEQATKVISFVQVMTFTSLNTLLGSRMAYLFAHNEKEEINKKRDFALNYIMTIGIGACFGLIGIAQNFVPVFFGDEYTEDILFLVLMAPLIPIMGISNLVGNLYYNPSGQRKKSTKLLIIGCCVNIAFNMCLIPIFNGCGAIIASVIAETVTSWLYVRYSKGFVIVSQIFKLSWKKVLAGVIMMLIVFVLGNFIGNLIVSLLLQIIFGILIYGIVMLILKDEFILQFKNIILKKLGIVNK